MRKYWTYDKCKEVSLKCNTKTELFKNHRDVYGVIYKNKWFELIEHFIKFSKPQGYWTYEKCKIEALKYNSRSDMSKGTFAYFVILRNKWYNLFGHMERIDKKRKRLIYVYEFSDNHCYVGLTCEIKYRNKQHLERDSRSSVYKYIIESGLTPNLYIKTEYVSVEEAILLEEKILNEYKENGWMILNKVKTGGIGSPNIKWTKEMCIIESKKYDKISTYQRNSSSSYTSALKNKWIDEICSHMKRCKSKNGYFNNKELCKIESLKYKNISLFERGCWSACNYSRKNGWLYEFFHKIISKNLPVVQQSK